jgi:hypothetical protein
MFVDHRGRVPNNYISMLSRGVTFGHMVQLQYSNRKSDLDDKYFSMFHYQVDSDRFVPLIKEHMSPESIRKPRYHWTSVEPDHPKVLIDSDTGDGCFFCPGANIVRDLGPDFDFNPINIPKGFKLPEVLDKASSIRKSEEGRCTTYLTTAPIFDKTGKHGQKLAKLAEEMAMNDILKIPS